MARLRASEARLRRELDAAPSSDDSNGPTKRRLSQLERELQSSKDELQRLRAMEFGSGEVAALRKRLEEETARADQADADAVTLADQLAQAGSGTDLRRIGVLNRADAAERRAQDLTARERKLDTLRPSVLRRGEVARTRQRRRASADSRRRTARSGPQGRVCGRRWPWRRPRPRSRTSACRLDSQCSTDLARRRHRRRPAEAPPKPRFMVSSSRATGRQ